MRGHTTTAEVQKAGLKEQKSPAMYVVVAVAWIATLFWFDPKLLVLYEDVNTAYQKGVVTVFILLLNLFWLFGTNYVVLSVFSLIAAITARAPLLSQIPNAEVAILYLTRNDFDPTAAASCLEQDYRDCHLYILDDSTRPAVMDQVNRFGGSHGRKVTIIRRCGRRGFKAGSINNALRQIKCNYFAIVDSDGVLPSNFTSQLMPYFSLDSKIAFVHGSNRPNPNQKTDFAADLALGIVPLWTTYFGPRNRFGFVPFLGHGAILRRDVWEAVGGMPEIVSEDLAFSTKAAELGYIGYFVGDVVSFEDFPSTYGQLRKQQEKYIKGGCEFIHRHLWSFLRSSRVRWFEKLDVALSCGSLFLPLVHAFFLIVFCLLLSHMIGEERTLGLRFAGVNLTLWKAHLIKESFHRLWSWDFYFITWLNMFAPMLGCVQLLLSAPKRLARLVVLSSVPYLSLMVVCAFGVLNYCLTRRAAFLVTGDQDDAGSIYSENTSRPVLAFVGSINSGHWLVHATELMLGLILCVFCFHNLNVALFGVALSLLMGSFLVRSDWTQAVKTAVSFPFLLIVTGMGLLGANLLAAQGVFFPLLLFHF